jgi:hypothetical protein
MIERMDDVERRRMPVRAIALRTGHALVAVVELWALGWVWYCGLARRRGHALRVAVGLLAAEGVALVIGRGNCPLGPFQSRMGDPVPLFELVLPPRAAKAAIPLLAAVAFAGLALVAGRGRARASAAVFETRIGVPAPGESTPPSARGKTDLAKSPYNLCRTHPGPEAGRAFDVG